MESTLERTFKLVQQGEAVNIYLDPSGEDYKGLRRVAESFAGDVQLVTGTSPELVPALNELSGTVIIAGVLGSNRLIDTWIAEGKLDGSSIKGRRECYQMQVLEQPVEGVEQALVIAGSDKRGAIYGIYAVSELIGVSPWVYFADVLPEKRPVLELPVSRLNRTSKEPSVKYRGIFLNDDWPSLGSWVTHAFGDFNEDFYDKVFELILRLKGNYLWPAMWSAEFSLNGKSSPIANAIHADEYGIIMGTSHHEPLFRAGSEWQKVYQQYGTSNLWDFGRNAQAITDFWEDGIKRNRSFPNLITLGMRGESDSALEGSDHENIELLKNIIVTQKGLLKKYNLEDAPQVLAVYKEVEKYWYGTAEVSGLKNWEVLDDVTILLSDDNFGNLRKIPEGSEQRRSSGWGMYYHFDYHGGPHSYEWLNTVPLEKVWEQMCTAYDYGIREVWVVNVGDLKPMELPISYFLDLAYDFEAWGTGAINKTEEYTQRWVQQQFGFCTDYETIRGIARVLNHYIRMNGRRKPEIIRPDTFSLLHYKEAERVLQEAIELEEAAEACARRIAEPLRDAYDQLVYFPAAASANIVKMQIYAGLNRLYAERGSVLANKYAGLVHESVGRDQYLEQLYNTGISGGKWQGMMSSPHVGYVNWNADGWSYPETVTIVPVKGSQMIVDVEGTAQSFTTGTAVLPPFTNLGKESYGITISSGSEEGFTFEVSGSADWLRLETSGGWIGTGETLKVTVEWAQLAGPAEAEITITGAGATVTVIAAVDWMNIETVPPMTFIEKHGVIAIEAAHTLERTAKNGAEWKTIDNYGRTLSSVKMYPDGRSPAEPELAPYLEYRLLVRQDSEYSLTAYIAPTNQLSQTGSLKYAAGFDGEPPVIADALPENFIGGDHDNEPWCQAVMDNIHTKTTTHKLTAGVHTLRFYGLDAGVVLQKLVLSAAPLPYSYFGPPESFCTGNTVR